MRFEEGPAARATRQLDKRNLLRDKRNLLRATRQLDKRNLLAGGEGDTST